MPRPRRSELRITRPCNICHRPVLMTRYQRFCARCRRRLDAYVPRQGHLAHDAMTSLRAAI